jgi:hypothetical protein
VVALAVRPSLQAVLIMLAVVAVVASSLDGWGNAAAIVAALVAVGGVIYAAGRHVLGWEWPRSKVHRDAEGEKRRKEAATYRRGMRAATGRLIKELEVADWHLRREEPLNHFINGRAWERHKQRELKDLQFSTQRATRNAYAAIERYNSALVPTRFDGTKWEAFTAAFPDLRDEALERIAEALDELRGAWERHSG